LVSDWQSDIHEKFFSNGSVFSTINARLCGSFEELFDPSSVFMSQFYGLEQQSTKLLYVVLLKGLPINPLKALQ
jgi:hypothetical protein